MTLIFSSVYDYLQNISALGMVFRCTCTVTVPLMILIQVSMQYD